MANILENKLKLSRSKTDPCLFYQKNKLGEVVFCLYVEDKTVMEEAKAVADTEKGLKKYLTIKSTDMNKYVGCTFIKTEKGLLLQILLAQS